MSLRRHVILLAVSVSLFTSFQPSPCLAELHRFEIEPYIWGHNISGRFGAGNLPPIDLDLTGSEASAGFSGRASYIAPSGWGLLISGYQSSADSEGTSPFPEFPGGLASTSMGRLLIAPQWELPLHSQTTARVFAGAQLSLFSLDVRLTRADFTYVQAEESRNWWDPVFGGEIQHLLTDTWFLYGSAALGGFGANSRLTTGLIGAVGYQFDPMFSVKLGYRYELNDYDHDGLLLDGTHQGLLLGIQFRV